MLFNSYTFLVFFLVVLVVSYLTPSWTVRKLFLLVASYVFYAAWNPPFVVLLWISTVTDWFLARRISSSRRNAARKLYLTLSLLVNLGLLGYFKYGSFLLDNFARMLSLAGWRFCPAAPSIILPVGISFYTFQTLSYSLDVYFGKMKPWHSFLDYALYVTFFPQLVAGPIVRACDYLPQCREPKRPSSQHIGWGLSLIVVGMFEKIVLADGLLSPAAEKVFEAQVAPGLLSAWGGTLAFAGQIFCDFAGYSACAIGVALCLGFELTTNFRFPYAALGFSDFWRRWHVSLSSWLRDYLYIPLGGSRKGTYRTYQNLMTTMLLGGLWHGASWTFVVWGGLHGVFLVGERLLVPVVSGAALVKKTPRITWALLTFLFVSVAWVLFRAHTLAQAQDVLVAMVGLQDHGIRLLSQYEIAKTIIIVGAIFGVHWLLRDVGLEGLASRAPWWLRSIALALMVIGIVTLAGEDRAFIYFQF